MKKKLLLAAIIFSSVSGAFATVHIIKVSNYQFTPATTNAVIGDTIVWIWKNGNHTTTSTTIPTGANPWDMLINTTHRRYGIRVTVAGTYNYKCTPHASFGMLGSINVSAPLAAGLYDFNVIASANNAFISWKTKQDNDISYYSLQRSFDNNNFSEIARIQPNSVSQSYSYTDKIENIQNKYVYYMLEMVDKNKNKELSDIKMFTQEGASTKLITSLSPNPINSPGHLMMQFNADAEGSMVVKLYDSKGQVIKQTEMTAVKGLNNGHFHLGTLTPGTYYLECKLGAITEKHTVIFR